MGKHKSVELCAAAIFVTGQVHLMRVNSSLQNYLLKAEWANMPIDKPCLLHHAKRGN